MVVLGVGYPRQAKVTDLGMTMRVRLSQTSQHVEPRDQDFKTVEKASTSFFFAVSDKSILITLHKRLLMASDV